MMRTSLRMGQQWGTLSDGHPCLEPSGHKAHWDLNCGLCCVPDCPTCLSGEGRDLSKICGHVPSISSVGLLVSVGILWSCCPFPSPPFPAKVDAVLASRWLWDLQDFSNLGALVLPTFSLSLQLRHQNQASKSEDKRKNPARGLRGRAALRLCH